MNKKYRVINWIFYELFVGLGIALCTKAGFGLSMIAAPPYILHVWLRDYFPWYTQGTSEYVWEAVVLLVTCLIIRKFSPKYLLSFLAAVITGFIIDGWLFLLGGNAVYAGVPARVLSFAAGLIVCALGVAFIFRSDLPAQTYELSVKEIAARFGIPSAKVKQYFDITMLVISVVLDLLLLHKFTGTGIGTVIATLVNSTIINMWLKVIDKIEQTPATESNSEK